MIDQLKYENSLPHIIRIERICSGNRSAECHWSIKITGWGKKKFVGYIDDEIILKLLKEYKNYYNYEKFELPDDI